MGGRKIDLELSPYIGRDRSRLSCTAGVGKQSCVKHESVCSINNHCRAVRPADCHCESSCILNLLKERLNRLIGITRRVEALVVLRELSR
jgi:hypothetical protein